VSRPLTPASRAGFTIVEVLVAILILSVGMLALAGTAAVVVRQTGSAARQTMAAAHAQSRFEQLRASPCAAMAGGADTLRGIVTAWTVTPVVRANDVTVTVTWPVSGGTRSRSYRSLVPC
jgi:type IV pilus modification protein PilV